MLGWGKLGPDVTQRNGEQEPSFHSCRSRDAHLGWAFPHQQHGLTAISAVLAGWNRADLMQDMM